MWKLLVYENEVGQIDTTHATYSLNMRIAYYPLMRRLVHTDLDHLAGTWSEKDFAEFQKRTADFEAVEEKMWK